MKKAWAFAALVLVFGASPARGEVTYGGSSTIGEYVIPVAAHAFTAQTKIGFGRIDMQGSGKGLQALARGEVDIVGVSRALSSEEKRRGLYYQIIGYDAVGVYVHPSNRVRALTRDQLKSVFTGTVTNWRAVGGADAPIVLITQILGSGRAQMVEFQEHAMGGAAYRADRVEVDRQPDVVAALLQERHAIGVLSPAFAPPGIRALAIEGFEPEPIAVRSGAYFLSRPLIVVARAHPTAAAKQFLDFLLGVEGQQIVARKFVPVR